jgi:catechol 2,3-dioxygenase-like lactoylglutathione lyase family enzyme
VKFAEVNLAGPPELTAFYRDELELPVDAGAIHIGETRLCFRVDGDGAFYHFAFLIPGDRFASALAWAEQRVELLTDRDGTPVFVGDAWDSSAVYFHDPAGNIGELIAHHGLEVNGRAGDFAADELVGLSELGLVGDRGALLRRLEALDLHMFRGTVDEPERLAFVGERGRTFILAPPGRGWVPTDRPAEPHPVETLIETPQPARFEL